MKELLEGLKNIALGQKPQELKIILPKGFHPPYLFFLYLLAKAIKARTIVELGTAIGSATRHLAAAESSARVYTYDIDVSLEEKLKELPVYPNIIFKNEDCRYPKDEIDNIDILFIDIEHNFSQTMAAYRIWKSKVRDGGLICLDDIIFNEEMKKVWQEMPEPKIELNELHYTGFGVVKK